MSLGSIQYVEEVIELLELQDLADATIGIPGFGLGVEARQAGQSYTLPKLGIISGAENGT